MTKPKEAAGEPKKHRLVDIARIYTPTDYARFKGVSRQRIYAMIESGKIKPENVYKRDTMTLIIHE